MLNEIFHESEETGLLLYLSLEFGIRWKPG